MARILVVEDNHANMKLACLLLRNAGHTALCAADAETGLTLARNNQPDLILMDIQLPGMDGLAATALLKQDPATAAIPVIALTAMAMKADQEKTRVAGCDAYIAKPLRYQELYAVIDTLLTKGDPQAAGEIDSSHHTSAPKRSLSGARELASESPSRDEARRNGRLILVAEDNESNQKIILRQLALLGFVADIAGNGRVALQWWLSGDYALLLTDLQMPEMDGYGLIEAIRATEQGGHRFPIVTMSASSSMRRDGGRLTSDMDDYLGKPLQLAELKAALGKWLPATASGVCQNDPSTAQSDISQSLDVGVLERLVGNDPAVVQEFLTEFRTSAARIAVKLRVACSEQQPAQVSDQAHKLMSSSNAVGALALGELCMKIELAGREGNMGTIEALLLLFEQELDAMNTKLDALAASPVIHGEDA
jgi:CheY-like chemotaxis protein/HPt (histidine-containing phosphotransfer) domain-containing protein